MTTPRRTSGHVELGDDAPVFVISVAAQLSGLHPQTLRQYDRMGIVRPGRTAGGGRRYSPRDVEQLREVHRLSGLGVGLEGVRRILELEDQVAALQRRVRELQGEVEAARAAADRSTAAVHASYRRDLVPLDRGAVVLWRNGGTRRDGDTPGRRGPSRGQP